MDGSFSTRKQIRKFSKLLIFRVFFFFLENVFSNRLPPAPARSVRPPRSQRGWGEHRSSGAIPRGGGGGKNSAGKYFRFRVVSSPPSLVSGASVVSRVRKLKIVATAVGPCLICTTADRVYVHRPAIQCITRCRAHAAYTWRVEFLRTSRIQRAWTRP